MVNWLIRTPFRKPRESPVVTARSGRRDHRVTRASASASPPASRASWRPHASSIGTGHRVGHHRDRNHGDRGEERNRHDFQNALCGQPQRWSHWFIDFLRIADIGLRVRPGHCARSRLMQHLRAALGSSNGRASRWRAGAVFASMRRESGGRVMSPRQVLRRRAWPRQPRPGERAPTAGLPWPGRFPACRRLQGRRDAPPRTHRKLAIVKPSDIEASRWLRVPRALRLSAARCSLVDESGATLMRPPPRHEGGRSHRCQTRPRRAPRVLAEMARRPAPHPASIVLSDPSGP